MSIFKRGSVYWYHFLFNGEHIQESTKQGNPRTARQIEAAHRTALAKGAVGIEERKAAPMFADLAQRFIAHVEARHENKPQTVQFYAAKLNRLLEYAPIAGARLDRIDEGVIEGYVVARRASVGPATVNRELAPRFAGCSGLPMSGERFSASRVSGCSLVSGSEISFSPGSKRKSTLPLALNH